VHATGSPSRRARGVRFMQTNIMAARRPVCAPKCGISLPALASVCISVIERTVNLGRPAFDDGEEPTLGVLLEVRCCTVSIERGLIVVLFV
jgi:hypothetical protein